VDADGDLLALTGDGVVGLGLGRVATADAARDGDRVHIVAERRDGHLVHTVVGPDPHPWADLGIARTATVGATTEGTSVVVAVRGDEGELVRRTIGLDGGPAGPWARLSATEVVDVDMAANLDGRLEVGGVTEHGTAFNAWQSEPPDGWSEFIDDRGGRDGVRTQLLANEDGRLELFVERTDGEVWNTWQVAQGRGWIDEWDPRYLAGARSWRIAVGVEGRLVAVALTDDGVVLRQQVPVPQADGTTKLMWPPSTVVTPLDPLGGVAPTALTVVDGEDGAVVVASGDGRTVRVPIDAEGPGAPEPVADVSLTELVPVDGCPAPSPAAGQPSRTAHPPGSAHTADPVSGAPCTPVHRCAHPGQGVRA
jgi:hypothetical protein